MQYTIAQLQTQLSIVMLEIEKNKALQHACMTPDYKPAIEYGEEARINHLRRAANNLAFLNKRKTKLEFDIVDKQEQEQSA